MRSALPSRRTRWPLALFGLFGTLLLPASSAFAPQIAIQAHARVEILPFHLHEPTGLARDPDTGDLFVSEADTGVILRLDLQSSLHTHATGFKRPRGLAWDPDDGGSLLVVDEKAGTLSRIARDGSITRLRDDLKKPQWVAIGEDGAIYVTAEGGAGFRLRGNEEGVLLKFPADGSPTQLLAKGLKRPEGLRVLPDGRVRLVADRWRSEPERDGGTVFEVTPGEATEVLVRSGFKRPHDLSLDALEATYLTADRQRDEGHREKGVIGKSFSGEGVALFATGLKEPQGLLFDPQGNLYVAEADTGRILKFLAPRPPTLDSSDSSLPAFTKEATLTLAGTAESNALLTVRGVTVNLSAQTDVSSQLAVRSSLPRFHPRTGLVIQTVILTNKGTTPLAGPLAVVVTNVMPPEGTLANATTTVQGHPAVEVRLVEGLLRPGETAQVVLQFRGLKSHQHLTSTREIWAVRPLAVSDAEGHFAFPVTLSPNTENHLELFATAAFGLGLTSAPVEVTVTHDDRPPIATITSPGNSAVLGSTSVTVRGSVQDQNLDAVTVNGVPAPVTGEVFEALTVPLPSEGTQGITATARDRAGNTATASVTVIRDTIPPTINITSPLPGAVTRQMSIAVQGTVADMNLDIVTVNGTHVPIAGDTFQVLGVPLSAEGSNILTATATDRAGNTATSSLTVIRDTLPPIISITSPSPGTATNQTTVTVTGSVSDATLDRVSVNDVLAALTGGTYEARSVPLPGEGSNTLTATATDRAGNFSTASVTVTRDTTSPTVTITSPANDSSTKETTVTVTGTVTDFSGVTAVVVNGIAATVTAGSYTVSVPLPTEGPNTLTVMVTDAVGNTVEAKVTVIRETTPSAPVIVAFDPPRAYEGEPLTIHGSGFGATPAENLVSFAGTTQARLLATVESASPTLLTVRVPTGAQTGPVIVQVRGIASNAFQFMVEGTEPRQIIGPVGSIFVGGNPAGVDVLQWLNLAVVARRGGGTLTLLDLEEPGIVDEVTVGGQPSMVAISDDLEIAFVGDTGSQNLTRVDLWAATVMDAVPLAAVPTDVAVLGTEEDIVPVFITQAPTNSVEALDGDSGTSLGTIQVGAFPTGLAVGDVSQEVWIANQGSRTLSGFEAVAPDFSPLGTVALPGAPEKIAIHDIPWVHRLAVVSLPQGNQVALVDLDALQVVATLAVGANPKGVAVSQERGLALVANFGNNTVSVIDLFARAVIATVPAGEGATGVAVAEDLQLAVVTNATDGTVTLIDLNPPPPAPVLSFTPNTGPVGALVTVQGLRFDASPGGSTVTFSSALGRIIAPVMSASATEIVVRVPDGATTGPVGVSTRAGAALSATNFLVTGNPLRIQITSPAEGAVIATPSVDVAGLVDLSTATVSVSVNGVPAQVTGNTFVAPTVPLLLGPTVLTATVVDERGSRASTSITVNGLALKILTATPAGGEAPLDVSFTLRVETDTPIRTFEMDFEGDGIVEQIFLGQFPALQFTYTREGVYRPTVIMTDDAGRRLAISTLVSVYTQASLVKKWEDMKAALRRGDIPGALEFIAVRSRSRYQQIFQILAADLPDIGNILTDLRPVARRNNEAIFEMRRVDAGIEKSFDVRFMLDEDGIWRLRAF